MATLWLRNVSLLNYNKVPVCAWVLMEQTAARRRNIPWNIASLLENIQESRPNPRLESKHRQTEPSVVFITADRQKLES